MTQRLRVAGRLLAALILVVLVALAVFVLVERVVADEDASGTMRWTAVLAPDYDNVS